MIINLINYNRTVIETQDYVFKNEGLYQIVYFAYDDSSNIARISYDIAVVNMN